MARLRGVLLVALVLVAQPGTAYKQRAEPSTTLTRFPPLMDCGPAPAAPVEGDGAFRANLLSLLGLIPAAAAAAAPAGFVTASLGTTGRDRAFARALCFDAANRSSSSGCRACLSAAARDATGGCGASRRAGVWRAGCFLAYADTDAASAREDAFRGWFYAGPNTTLKDGVCTGPDCARCFEDARRAAAALRWLVRMRGEEVIVVGYGCCLRVQMSALPMRSDVHCELSVILLFFLRKHQLSYSISSWKWRNF